jgi:hypothetical protein
MKGCNFRSQGSTEKITDFYLILHILHTLIRHAGFEGLTWWAGLPFVCYCPEVWQSPRCLLPKGGLRGGKSQRKTVVVWNWPLLDISCASSFECVIYL